MKKFLPLLIGFALLVPSLALGAGNPFAGRWDITINAGDETYPGWLQVAEKDGKPDVMVQPRSGHAHPAEAKLAGSNLLVTVSEATQRSPAVTWELAVSGDKLSGTQTRGDKAAKVAGVRAPALKRPMPKAWSEPKPLLNGKDLGGWEPFGSGSHTKNNWVMKDGVLVNLEGGANLKTTHEFEDFKLHVEFNCPAEGNSGIYLRGRYEVQVSCGALRSGGNPVQALGAVYGYLPPSKPVAAEAGEWQTYDITLVGRTVTVVYNGETLVDGKEIPGITGGALDSHEGKPGPFYIQGDHTGGIQFRNVTIQTPKG